MLNCGNPDKMGYVQYRCLNCGETRRIAFTCKSCFCLTCAKPYTDNWIEFISHRLFPGLTYRHFVFTMPDFLCTWFYRHPELLSDLMRTGYVCLKDVFQTTSRDALDIGVVMVLQTAGRPATYNSHLHMIVTEGGLTLDNKWKPVSYIPFEMMHKKWQHYLLCMMKERINHPRAQADIDKAWRDYPKGFVAFIDKGRAPEKGEGLAEYLAKYLVSPPISVRRIEQYDGKTVTYWYRDHKTEQIKHETLPVLKFIGRMVQHILPKGFQRIRYYGIHSHVRYTQMRPVIAKALPRDLPLSPDGFRVKPRKPFATLFEETFGINPLLCPECKNDMELELIYHPKYGIIKDVLKLFTGFSHEFFSVKFSEQQQRPPPGRRYAVHRPQRMVQILLPQM